MTNAAGPTQLALIRNDEDDPTGVVTDEMKVLWHRRIHQALDALDAPRRARGRKRAFRKATAWVMDVYSFEAQLGSVGAPALGYGTTFVEFARFVPRMEDRIEALRRVEAEIEEDIERESEG